MAKISPLVKSRLKKAENCLSNDDYQGAINLYQQIFKTGHRDPGILIRLGTLYRLQSDYDKAAYYGKQAVDLIPNDAFAHHTLGAALHLQNNLDEAIYHYREAIRLDPKLTESHYHLANALRESGELEQAVSTYEDLLNIEPNHFEALNNCGALLTNMAQAEKAVQILNYALKLQPDSIETQTNLARAHILIGSQFTAMDLLTKVLDTRPEFIDAWAELAWAQRLNGQYSDSLDSFDKAIELSPGDVRALAGKAKIMEIQGKYHEAYELLEPLLDSESPSVAIPTFFDISKHIKQRDRAVSLIEKQLASETLNISGSSPLHFRLGKHYDQEKDFDTAIKHFHLANQRSQRQFDIKKIESQFSEICNIYKAPETENLQHSDCSSLLPVFIVGMPRSGTSLVETILASHPEVYGAGETLNIENTCSLLAERYPKQTFPGFAPALSKAILNDTAGKFLSELSTLSPTATRITDKMPHNFVFIGLILQLFPACKIIHCKRDMLDTCLSCYFSEFGSNFHNYAYDLSTLGQYYGLYSMLMEHWKSVYPNRIYEIEYEKLVDQQEQESRSLISHCELEWDDNCLNFHQLDRVINTISYDQVRQPIYRRSMKRWKNYVAHLGPLRDGLIKAGIPSEKIPD